MNRQQDIITEETQTLKLLALNALLEAARAGEDASPIVRACLQEVDLADSKAVTKSVSIVQPAKPKAQK